MNQVIFVRGFRGKKRRLFRDLVPEKIEGNADPTELKKHDGPPADDDGFALILDDVGDTNPVVGDRIWSCRTFLMHPA